MKETQDRRIRKTKRQLRDAMITLMQDHSIAEITVREITELADINRGTFYLHYRDVYDMVEQIENEIFAEFNTVVNARNGSQTIQELEVNMTLLFEDIFNYMADNALLCSALLGPNGDIAFLQRLITAVRAKCIHNWDTWYNRAKSGNFDTYATFIVAGCIGVVQEWLAADMLEPPARIARTVHDIIVRGIQVLK
jgi:AcrR family transcriptional regulator